MVATQELAQRFVQCRRTTVAQLCDGVHLSNTVHVTEAFAIARMFKHMKQFGLSVINTPEGRIHVNETLRVWVLAECIERARAMSALDRTTSSDLDCVKFNSHMLCIQNLRQAVRFSDEITESLRLLSTGSLLPGGRGHVLADFVRNTTTLLRAEMRRCAIPIYTTDSGLVYE